MKEACRTNLDIPSLSLLKTVATELNSKVLQQAVELNTKTQPKNVIFQFSSSSHENLTIRVSDLIINPSYPYGGATPDTIAECKCCGISCLEIKCPYSHRGDSIPQMLEKKFLFI